MPAARVYLDHNASAPLRPAARAAMAAAGEIAGNPSSVHAEGRRARAVMEDAREAVARLVNARPAEVIFTSGGAEANATVMAGGWSTVLLSRLEHDSVLSAAAAGGFQTCDIPVGTDGVARVEAVADRLLRGQRIERGLAVLQAANNETGVMQPAAALARLARAHDMAVHCDAVQAVGRVPVDFAGLGVDFMAVSAHKIGGPKGVGALIVREDARLAALIAGGQERRRRGGTQNLPGIAGFGAAATDALAQLAHQPCRIAGLRDGMEAAIRAVVPGVVIIGDGVARLPNTSCLALPGQRAETLVIRLDLMGFAVSAGAACSSGKVGDSAVLAAMGLPPGVARAAIRVSLGQETTPRDVERFVAAVREVSTGVGPRGLDVASNGFDAARVQALGA